MSENIYSIRFKPSQDNIENDLNQRLQIEKNKDDIKHPLSDDASRLSDPIEIPTRPSPSTAVKLPHSQSAPLSELLSQLPDEKQSLFSGIRDKLAKVGAESREMIDKHISNIKSAGNTESGKNPSSPILENKRTQEMLEIKSTELEDLSNASSSGVAAIKSPVVNIENLMNMVLKRDRSRDDLEFVKEVEEFCDRRRTQEVLPIKRSTSLDKMMQSRPTPERKEEIINKKVDSTVRYNKESSSSNVFLRRRLSQQNICLDKGQSDIDMTTKPIVELAPASTIGQIFNPVYRIFTLKRFMVFIGILAYFLISPHTYYSGLLVGLFLGYLITFLSSFFKSKYNMFWGETNDFLKSLQMEAFDAPINADGRFKGWMNELMAYNPEKYHISQTHSVYVTLEGFTLRLQTPRQGVPKRALCGEEIPNVVGFVRQQHYNLRGCKVKLLPKDLTSKRLWSKKYPICLEISLHLAGISRSSRPFLKDSNKRHSLGRLDAKSCLDTKYIYLFARCCREKEEWFRRLESASRGFVWPQNFSSLLLKDQSVAISNASSENSEENLSLGEMKLERQSKGLGVVGGKNELKRSKSIDGMSTGNFIESKKKKVPTATLR